MKVLKEFKKRAMCRHRIFYSFLIFAQLRSWYECDIFSAQHFSITVFAYILSVLLLPFFICQPNVVK